MNKQQIKQDFQENFKELRIVLNSWELIPGAPKDEFDGLNHQILNNLYKGANLAKIKRVIESELCVTYGLYSHEFKAHEMASEIIDWWNEMSENEQDEIKTGLAQADEEQHKDNETVMKRFDKWH